MNPKVIHKDQWLLPHEATSLGRDIIYRHQAEGHNSGGHCGHDGREAEINSDELLQHLESFSYPFLFQSCPIIRYCIIYISKTLPVQHLGGTGNLPWNLESRRPTSFRYLLVIGTGQVSLCLRLFICEMRIIIAFTS